mmetsp:Transcript_47466/g.118578  ORF Transcript_47466/g.118578 Transcript_47466/m.118578 type:complete len:224 (-) Transcript_47466:2184-2855(-)
MLHRTCHDERFLWVVEDMGEGVHPQVVVARVDAHSLLPHSGLVAVPGRLVVVGERDDGRAHTKDHRWVYLAVGVGGAVGLAVLEVVEKHRHHTGLLLFRVDVLDEALADKIVFLLILGVPPDLWRVALDLLDVLLLDRKLLVLIDNEERPRCAAAISEDLHLLVVDVPDDGDLKVYGALPPHLSQLVDQLLAVAVHADPVAVEEHLGSVFDLGGLHFVQRVES